MIWTTPGIDGSRYRGSSSAIGNLGCVDCIRFRVVRGPPS